MVRSAQADVRNRDLIEKLRHQVAGLRRQRYGVSSELLDQLERALEDEEVARAVTPASAVPEGLDFGRCENVIFFGASSSEDH